MSAIRGDRQEGTRVDGTEDTMATATAEAATPEATAEATTTAGRRRLRRLRLATLGSLGTAVFTSLLMPGVGLFRDTDPVRIALGTAGIVAFAAAQAAVLYAAVTPTLSARFRRGAQAAFAAASVLSVPLTAGLARTTWETWAWVAASIVGTAPLLGGRRAAAAVMAAAVTAAAAIGWWNGARVWEYVLISAGVGAMTIGVTGLHAQLWNLLVAAREGRSAQARLAVVEERLRFARDLHDLLGHTLSVIALKAELAERLARADPGRAETEAAEVRRLAASALADLRRTVHGHRAVDLRGQLTAVAQVLRSSGVRCTVVDDGSGDLPPAAATALALVLREAGTNVLRHSEARWCTIELSREEGLVRMTVTNDGARDARPDRHSSGLRGLGERLAEDGGALRTRIESGVFTLESTLPVASP
ncbi:sensor histidine kinase [Actinomadura viridis]|uniref:sensor histidine kinase n=1 Tax=Actinomadura viridis TaxID=58110 RepID=UPI0036AA889C